MHRYLLLALSVFLVYTADDYWRQSKKTGSVMEEQLMGCNPDTGAPIVIYPAQGLSAQIDPCNGSQAAVFFFTLYATDECDPNPRLDVAVNVPAGASFFLDNPFGSTYIAIASPGSYQVVATAEDASGNIRQEDFAITATQEAPTPANAACNDTIIVNLGAGCQRLVLADMLLEGNLGCLINEQFQIEIADANPANGNILDGIGIFPYAIEPIQTPLTQGFQGVFGPSAWRQRVDVAGQVSFNGTADTLRMQGSASAAFAVAILPIAYDGVLSFDWGTANLSNAVFSGQLLDEAGAINSTFSSVGGASGQLGQMVNAGYKLLLYLESADGGNPAILPQAWITNWSFSFSPLAPSGVLPCWGFIDARDGTAPSLSCPGHTNIATIQGVDFPLFCGDYDLVVNKLESLNWTGQPLVSDNCGPVSLNFSDLLQTNGDCGEAILFRTFIATDAVGNSASCVQQITFRRVGPADITLPPATAAIECGEDFPLDEYGNPSPDITGYPLVITASDTVDLRDTYCNLGTAYEDSPFIEVCPLSYKFIRTWTILDWCNPASSFTYSQTIKIGDFTAPEVRCPLVDLTGDGIPDPLVYTTGPFACTATFTAPLPVATDNCSPVFITTEIVTDRLNIIFDPYGQPVDTLLETIVLAVVLPNAPNRIVTGIPAGCHRFRYIVKDECDNTAIQECGFCVEDRIEPVAICKDLINASLGAQGLLRLFAEHFDNGSYDNCAIAKMEVRREITHMADCAPTASAFTPWGPFVEFSCCDLDTEVLVEFRVIDEAGNQNTCWLNLLVEDKQRPLCIPPADLSRYCDELPYDFDPLDTTQLQALFGLATATDNCGAAAEELPPVLNLDGCGTGAITRRFRAVDASGNVSTGLCQQLVLIQAQHNYEIKFPRDAEANCGYPNPDTIGLHVIGCDLLAVSVQDNILAASGNECYKIFRIYRVINWCEYDGIAEPVVVGRDEDCDGLPGDEDVWVLRRPAHTFIDRDNNENNANPAIGTIGASCVANPEGYWRKENSIGFWEYRQDIKVYDTIPPQILFVEPLPICSVDGVNCWAEVEYPFIVTDNCTPNDLQFTIIYDEFADGTPDDTITNIFGVYPKWKIQGFYPIGKHAFRITVRDGCGNVAQAALPFEVVDCKAPTPTCINGLATTLMPVFPSADVNGDGVIDFGATTVFAVDFIASPSNDCLAPVTYSMNRAGEQPDKNQDYLILTCDDLGIVVVELYAWDAAGNPYAVQPNGSLGGPNYGYCETFVLVQNNLAQCGDSLGVVAGRVEREDGIPVAGVNLNLSGTSSASFITAEDGAYAFNDLFLNSNYTVSPFKDGDDHNGLSTYDIVLIMKHILGTQLLDSPYKLIAADVNRSGSVTTLDVIQLRQVLLSVIPEFPANTSWRFVPKSYVFPNPANPWQEPFPESISFERLDGPKRDEHFVAIKIGDIDLSAQLPGFSPVEGRSQGQPLVLWGEDARLDAGEEHLLTIQGDFTGILGLQGALHFEPAAIELGGLEASGLLQAWNYHVHPVSGRLFLSWDANPPLQGEQILFTLRLKARRALRLSEVLRFDDSSLIAEAYGEDYRRTGLALALGQDYSQLFQNYPNPFRHTTVIPFKLAKAGRARLDVFDVHGRWLHTMEGDFASGYHQFKLEREALPGPGVYLYCLQAAGQRWTQRMLLTD